MIAGCFRRIWTRFTTHRSFCTNSNPVLPVELTIAIVKPHVVSQPHIVEEINDVLLKEGFHVVLTKEAYLTRLEASKFYDEHRGRFFYQRAVELMSSGPLVVNLLARKDAIQHWRNLMGPTKVFRCKLTHPDTLRGRFGLTDTRNAVHGSDSPNSTARECVFFFPEFDVTRWFAEEAPALS